MAKTELIAAVKLTKQERLTLAESERTIEQGFESQWAQTLAFKTIHDQQLWRENYNSFKSYVADRWEGSLQQLMRNFAAVETLVRIEEIPNIDVKFLPHRERQLRELTDLTPAQLKKVIKTTNEKVLSDQVPFSAKLLRKVRQEVVAPKQLTNGKPAKAATSNPLGYVENGAVLKEVMNDLHAITRKLKAIEKKDGLELIVSRRNGICRDIDLIKGAVQICKPEKVCPKCNGKKCPACGNMGWVNKALLAELE